MEIAFYLFPSFNLVSFAPTNEWCTPSWERSHYNSNPPMSPHYMQFPAGPRLWTLPNSWVSSPTLVFWPWTFHSLKTACIVSPMQHYSTPLALLILCSLPETLLATRPPSQLPLMPFKTQSFSASSSPDPSLKLGYTHLLCVPTTFGIASSYNTA